MYFISTKITQKQEKRVAGNFHTLFKFSQATNCIKNLYKKVSETMFGGFIKTSSDLWPPTWPLNFQNFFFNVSSLRRPIYALSNDILLKENASAEKKLWLIECDPLSKNMKIMNFHISEGKFFFGVKVNFSVVLGRNQPVCQVSKKSET